MKEEIQTLALTSITRDPRLQMRVSVDEAYINSLVDVIYRGEEFDGQPPVVYRDADGVNWLAGGNQRFAAHERARKKQMKCIVREGAFRDAFLFALSDNTKHGVRLTNADKRRAVESAVLFPELEHASNREIAKLCGCDEKLVRNVKRSFSAKPKEEETAQPNQALPETELAVHDFIRRHLEEMQRTPTMQEIAKGLGLSSALAASKYANALMTKGYITRDNNPQRSVMLIRVKVRLEDVKSPK